MRSQTEFEGDSQLHSRKHRAEPQHAEAVQFFQSAAVRLTHGSTKLVSGEWYLVSGKKPLATTHHSLLTTHLP